MMALVLAAMLSQAPEAPLGALKARLIIDMMLEAPSTRTIEKGDQSNIDDAKQVLVRTDAEWAKLWQQHAGDRPRPSVDFSKEMVVGVFMGSRPNAGFSTSVISATAGNGALIVRYTETMPGKGMVSAQVLTFPFHLVAIPKAAVSDVKFEKVQ
jgi:PrcB C-terminal